MKKWHPSYSGQKWQNRSYTKKHCLMNGKALIVFSSIRIPRVSLLKETSHMSGTVDQVWYPKNLDFFKKNSSIFFLILLFTWHKWSTVLSCGQDLNGGWDGDHSCLNQWRKMEYSYQPATSLQTHQSQETGLIRTVLMPACAGIQFSPAWTQRRAFPSDAESGCAKLRLILLKLLYWKMPNL